jgi:Transketolase, pyrimidine binding domain
MTQMRYVDGLKRAIELEMERDQRVIVLGEDVGVGGPFGITAGLLERFGDRRIINTPISEDSIMGLATGAALAGKRPIIEIMFVDFITLAMSQLVNHTAKLRFMSGGQRPAGDPRAARRRRRLGRASFAKPGSLVPPCAGPQGGSAVQCGRRAWPAARRDP